jgi:hypothetical protein
MIYFGALTVLRSEIELVTLGLLAHACIYPDYVRELSVNELKSRGNSS